MQNHCCNLNIHWSIPRDVMEKLNLLFTQMPNWLGYVNNIPYWFSSEPSECYIYASFEASGLSIVGCIDKYEWEAWISLFKSRASIVLGYEIGEPEDGYDFVVY